MRIATDETPGEILPADAGLNGIGRRGELRYEFEWDGRTVLGRSSCSSPWHHFPPSYLDASGCAYIWLVNPSGGLAGGDHVTVDARLQDDTHVLITSPSANRVYRTVSEPAVQDIRLSVGAGARLEWLPELAIPFAGSRFHQSIHVDLAPGATLVLWDAMASGRIARGERWAFAEYANEIQIHCDSGGAAVERFQLTPETVGTVAAQWDYVASLFVVGDGISSDRAKRLHERLFEICDRQPGALLGGVSEPAAPGIVVKVVARSAHTLAGFLDAAWTGVRHCLWDMPAPALRRY
jgi:urease accessory protein